MFLKKVDSGYPVPARAPDVSAPIARKRQRFRRSGIDHHVLFDGVEYVDRGKRRKPVRIFDGMTAIVPKGRKVAILGPKRSGKTTLVRLICGVSVPTAGRIVRNSSISWPVGKNVFNSAQLTVRDNLIFCAHLFGVPLKDFLEYADFLCEFGPYMRRDFRDLPNWYRARINIVAPLVVDFDCYLVDDGFPIEQAKFSDDRLAYILEQFAAKDMIAVSSRKPFVRKFCDTGAVIKGGHIEYRESLAEALDELATLPPGDEGVGGEEDEGGGEPSGWEAAGV